MGAGAAFPTLTATPLQAWGPQGAPGCPCSLGALSPGGGRLGHSLPRGGPQTAFRPSGERPWVWVWVNPCLTSQLLPDQRAAGRGGRWSLGTQGGAPRPSTDPPSGPAQRQDHTPCSAVRPTENWGRPGLGQRRAGMTAGSGCRSPGSPRMVHPGCCPRRKELRPEAVSPAGSRRCEERRRAGKHRARGAGSLQGLLGPLSTI